MTIPGCIHTVPGLLVHLRIMRGVETGGGVYSQRDFAKFLGMNYGHYCRLEEMATKFSLADFIRICVKCDLDLYETALFFEKNGYA